MTRRMGDVTARDKLVTATIDLMRRNGVAGTAIAEIMSESGLARRSIYLNFSGGKSELISEATRASGSAFATVLEQLVLKDDPVSEFTEMWVQLLAATDFDAGCPVVAAALARSGAPDAADEAGSVFATWHRIVTTQLMDDGAERELAGSLATTALAAIEGAVIMAQAQRVPDPLYEVRERLHDLLALHLPQRYSP